MRVALSVLVVVFMSAGAAGFDFSAVGLQAIPVWAGFDFPVSFAFASDGRVFVTERAGEIKVIDRGAVAIWATFNVLTNAEQGVLGLALHPDFATNGWLYVYYTDAGNATNRVARLHDVGGVGGNLTVIVDGIPQAFVHNGGILAFARDGTLFISTGDATNPPAAQDPAALNGKILRVEDDGGVPADNPLGSLVYSYGHRNVFGLAVDPQTGHLWETENGPNDYDEVNRIVAGGNYGWPDVMGPSTNPAFVDPAHVFRFPLPALTQAVFYTGTAYGEASRGALFFGAYNNGVLYRARLTEDRMGIASVDAVHAMGGWGIVDVEQGLDGRLYVSAVDHDGSGGGIFALDVVAPIGDHALVFAVAVAVLAALFAIYLWKRRQSSRRERS